MWDVRTGLPLFTLQGHTSPVSSVALSPDGKRVASGVGTSLSFILTSKQSKNEVRIWDGATGAPLFDLRAHTDSVRSVAFSPDGRRLASGSRG